MTHATIMGQSPPPLPNAAAAAAVPVWRQVFRSLMAGGSYGLHAFCIFGYVRLAWDTGGLVMVWFEWQTLLGDVLDREAAGAERIARVTGWFIHCSATVVSVLIFFSAMSAVMYWLYVRPVRSILAGQRAAREAGAGEAR